MSGTSIMDYCHFVKTGNIMVGYQLNYKFSSVLTRFTIIFLFMWSVWVPNIGYAQQCKAPLTDSSLKQLTEELCGETFAMIDRITGALNLGGGARDEDLERLIAILNTIDGQSEPDAKGIEGLMRDAGRILFEKPALRGSLKKNLVVSLFENHQIQRWCRWLRRGKTEEKSVTNQKIVDSIDEIIRCGIE